MLNQGTQRDADAALMEKAIVSGDTVLRQLLLGESHLPGERDYLAMFRARETQPPPANLTVRRSLRRRLLIAEDADVLAPARSADAALAPRARLTHLPGAPQPWSCRRNRSKLDR